MGVPTSVPIGGLQAFLKTQEELKRRYEAGEPLMTPEEEAELREEAERHRRKVLGEKA